MIRMLKCENKIVSLDMYIADSFISRFLGFMFRKIPHHETIMLTPCNSIHTYFMRFDLDILFVNKDMQVVKKIDGLKPRRLVLPVKEVKLVIEGKQGLFSDINIGEHIGIY